MEVTSASTVEELAARIPRAARVFEILGIDFCCNAQRSLAAASKAAGYDPDEVVALSKGSHAAARPTSHSDWKTAPLAEVTAHITGSHHRRARHMLVDLLERIAQVASAHAATQPELWRLKDEVEQLAHDLVPHMSKEERFLFPYIDTMDRPTGPDTEVLVPLFGTVEYPLQSIRHDHSHDLTVLGRIRDLSRGFTPPDTSCEGFRQLYAMLAEFDRELSQHIHLENDILFLRATELERKAAGKLGR